MEVRPFRSPTALRASRSSLYRRGNGQGEVRRSAPSHGRSAKAWKSTQVTWHCHSTLTDGGCFGDPRA